MSIEKNEPSLIARQTAARAWCTERTKNIEMDSDLAMAFSEILDQYIEALQWCSGSADFGPGGQAHEGWEKVVRPLLEKGTIVKR